MVISEAEYLEMKNQIDQLKAKVDNMGGNKSIRDSVDCLPYEFIKNIEDDVPIFVPFDSGGDTWNLFMRLAKILHKQDWKFYMDSTMRFSCKNPYIRTVGNHNVSTRISQLSDKQITLSVQMLNELIPIYNKFFQMAHEVVLYKPDDSGGFQNVKVTYME